MRREARVQVVKKSLVNRMPLKGKPSCPYCGKTLIFIYNDVKEGHLGQKCGKCGKVSILDIGSLKTYQIVDDVNNR